MRFYFILFIKTLQHRCWRSVGHQVLQPTKGVKLGQYALLRNLKCISFRGKKARKPIITNDVIWCSTRKPQKSIYSNRAFSDSSKVVIYSMKSPTTLTAIIHLRLICVKSIVLVSSVSICDRTLENHPYGRILHIKYLVLKSSLKI